MALQSLTHIQCIHELDDLKRFPACKVEQSEGQNLQYLGLLIHLHHLQVQDDAQMERAKKAGFLSGLE